jgi:hypothetical protein
MDYKRRIVAEFSARNKAKGTMAAFRRDLTSTSRTIRRMATATLALAGIGGIGYMIKQQMSAIDSTAKLSDRLGMGTEALVSMQHAAKISGVETATLNKSLEIFSRRLGEVDMGVGQAKYSLDQLGLNYQDLINKSPDEAIGIVADQINRLETQAQKAAAANYLFGRSGQQLLNLFEQGSAGIAEYRREAERLGLTFSRIDAAKVEAANDALTRSRAVMTGLFRTATIELAPYIEAAATAFNDWATSGEGVAAKMVDAFEAVTLSVVTAARETENLIRTLNQYVNPLDTAKAMSRGSENAWARYRRETGERNAGRSIDLMNPPIQPKDRALFDRILQEERTKLGMGPAEDRSKVIERTFAQIRRDAQQRAANTFAAEGTLPANPNLPSLAKRRMSSQAWQAQVMAEYSELDRMRAESEDKYGQAMIKNAELAEKAASDRARAVARMYDTIRVYDRAAYNAKRSLLDQELEEFRRLKVAETDIYRYELERQRELHLEFAREGDDLAKGFRAEWEELKLNRLTLGEVGVNTADTIHSEWVGAFQDMATEGASWSDAMKGFFQNVGDSFSDMMAQMAAEALLYKAMMPVFSALWEGVFPSQGSRYTGTAPANFTNRPGIIEGPAAAGTVATRPTFGLYGEAGPEAILPLQRGPGGRLGVAAVGAGQSAVNVQVHLHNEGPDLNVDRITTQRDAEREVKHIWLRLADNDPAVRRRLGR